MKGGLLILLLLLVAGCSESDDVDENQTINNSTNITESVNLSPDSEEVDNETEEEPLTRIGACHDSDGGKAYDELGYVRLNNSGNLDYMDSCISVRHIREYYCNEENPGTLTFEAHPCSPDICEDGICIPLGNESS